MTADRTRALRARAALAVQQQAPLLLLIGVAVGAVAGLASIVFHLLIHAVEATALGTHDGVLTALPTLAWYWYLLIPTAGGVLVAPIVYGWAAEARGHGVPEVMEAVQVREGVMRPRVAVAKSIASAITIGTGGSVGREGPVVQIGSVLGSIAGQLLRLPVEQRRTLVGCGAAAGIAATFNAPIAGAFFALEVILGNFAIATFSPIVLACVVATVVSRAYFGNEAAFSVPAYELVSWYELLPYAILGLLCGVLAVTFVAVLYRCEDLVEESPVPPLLRPALGGLLLGVMLLISPHLYGSGFASLDALLHGNIAWTVAASLIVLKLLACTVTLSSGGSGGVFSPSLFLGAATGYAFGHLVNLLEPTTTAPPQAYAMVGMGALLGGATHAPVASILILFELTSDYGIILPLMLAITMSTLAARVLMTDSIYTRKLRRKGISQFRTRDDIVMTSFRVGDVMRHNVPLVSADASLAIVLENFIGAPIDELYVVDSDNRLRGCISLHDIKEILGEEGLDHLLTAIDLSNVALPTAEPRDTLADCLRQLAASGRESLPVVDGRDTMIPVGVIARKDLIDLYDREVLRREMIGTFSAADGARGAALPSGYRLETITIPENWQGKSLRDLALRQRSGVTVVGIRAAQGDGLAEAANPEQPLSRGDALVVLGSVENVVTLRRLVAAGE
jgi:CIC family chloride channel protein